MVGPERPLRYPLKRVSLSISLGPSRIGDQVLKRHAHSRLCTAHTYQYLLQSMNMMCTHGTFVASLHMQNVHVAAGAEGLKRGGLARFLNRHVSREHATLEVYLSHGLAVTSVLGPVAKAAPACPRLTAHAARHEQHDRQSTFSPMNKPVQSQPPGCN